MIFRAIIRWLKLRKKLKPNPYHANPMVKNSSPDQSTPPRSETDSFPSKNISISLSKNSFECTHNFPPFCSNRIIEVVTPKILAQYRLSYSKWSTTEQTNEKQRHSIDVAELFHAQNRQNNNTVQWKRYTEHVPR